MEIRFVRKLLEYDYIMVKVAELVSTIQCRYIDPFYLNHQKITLLSPFIKINRNERFLQN